MSIWQRQKSTYEHGRLILGWRCRTCGRQFAHDGRHLRTFARFVAHVIVRHRRLPNCRCLLCSHPVHTLLVDAA